MQRGKKIEGPTILGPGQGRGGQIRVATLHSITKAQRKALSKERLSNKSTSLHKHSNNLELNLTMSTSSRYKMWNLMCSLEMTSM